MASQKEIKGRIASVKGIQKITSAMEMVAAARLRRAEQRSSPCAPTPARSGDMGRPPRRRRTAKLPMLQEHEG